MKKNKRLVPPRSPFTTPFSPTAQEMGLRLRSLFQWKKKRPPLVVLGLVCAGVVLSGSLVSCQTVAVDDPSALTTDSVPQGTEKPQATGKPEETDTPQTSQVPDLNYFFGGGWGSLSWEELLNSGARFNGSSLLNPDEIALDYSILNGSFTHTMRLQSGDVLDVALQVDEGTLGIAIEGSDGTPLYQNDDLDTSQFHLEISQTDSYQVTITGSNTKGSIHLKV